MKRLKDFITMLVLSTIVLVTGFMSSCTDYCTPDKSKVETQVKSALPDALSEVLPDMLEELSTPKFYDSIDAIVYKMERLKRAADDSIFLSLPDETIANISHVLVNYQKTCTVSDIVNEYTEYKHIYDNLPQEMYRTLNEPSTTPKRILQVDDTLNKSKSESYANKGDSTGL